jgi:hypothetical protein
LGRDRQADEGREMVTRPQCSEQVGSSSVSAHMGHVDCLPRNLCGRDGMKLRLLRVMMDTVKQKSQGLLLLPMGQDFCDGRFANDHGTYSHWSLSVSGCLCTHLLRPRVSRRPVDSYAGELGS